jgi:hypothetical protein
MQILDGFQDIMVRLNREVKMIPTSNSDADIEVEREAMHGTKT